MKNLILYGSTYGFTGDCANELAKKLKAPTVCSDIKNVGSVNLNDYDTVIIGSSVYMGMMNKGIREWITVNIEKLKQKRLAFFVCCGFAEMVEKHLETNIPKELLDQSVSKECFGGKMDISKMGFMHKFITKIVTKDAEKKGQKSPELLPANIEKMAQTLNSFAG